MRRRYLLGIDAKRRVAAGQQDGSEDDDDEGLRRSSRARRRSSLLSAPTEHVKDDDLAKYLESMDICPDEARTLFRLLDLVSFIVAPLCS